MCNLSIFHPLDAAGIELPPMLNNPFSYEPHPLCQKAYHDMLQWPIMQGSCADFASEIGRGKMFGVLVVENADGQLGFLAAFSGQICSRFDWEGFVPPVFDYLIPHGHFEEETALIGNVNMGIEQLETVMLPQLQEKFRSCMSHYYALVDEAEANMHRAKIERDRRRAQTPPPTEDELAEMKRQSQFLKAEVRRAKKQLGKEIAPHIEIIEHFTNVLKQQKNLRKEKSEELQKWLFDNTILQNSRGQRLSVRNIFFLTSPVPPPSGSGECCAPKLLNYAFSHQMRPIAMAEYWYGQSPKGEVRHHGSHYPACRGKCKPLLEWMLDGVELMPATQCCDIEEPTIIYEDRYFCVVEKPHGMISVPGTSDRLSLLDFLKQHYGPERDVRLAHRLDEDTSGLVVATFGLAAYRQLQVLFANRSVDKTYIALLDGDPIATGMAPEGTISLPLMPDIDDRPRQRVSYEGKAATTQYRILGTDNEGHTIIEFHPLTGRTHQLRVHAASPLGLGAPIVGDRLYGHRRDLAQRLMLHATALSFVSPFDGTRKSFSSVPPFDI